LRLGSASSAAGGSRNTWRAAFPVRDDGRLDLDEALAWIESNGQLQSHFGDRGVRKWRRK
jgi:hypothetical protein